MSHTITISLDGYTLTISPPVVSNQTPTPADSSTPCPQWSYLSPLTMRVVALLCRSGWMSREKIAESIGEAPEGKLASLLPDLVVRGVLEASTAKGYHLGIPHTAEPEAYRKIVLAWIETQDTAPSAEPRQRRPRDPDLTEADLGERIAAARREKAAQANGHTVNGTH